MRMLGGRNYRSCACVLVVVAAMLGSGLSFGQEPIHVAVNLVNVAFSCGMRPVR